MKSLQLCLVVAPYRSVIAFPLSYTSAVTATRTYAPPLVISICLFFLFVVFLVIKLVYMKHRRMGTIHAPSGTVRPVPTASNLDKQGSCHRGLLVGCLGSPTWETNLTSKLGRAWRREQRRQSSSGYHLHARSTSRTSRSGSRFTKSTTFTSCSGHADQLVLPPSSVSSRVTSRHGSSSSKALLSVQRRVSANGYGDFGEFHSARLPEGGIANIARRVSPSSIRLVDGPSCSNHVEYSFLSALPPDAHVRSPLMGLRDSIQLSRCSLMCSRKPAPPLPSLPSFIPFHLPKSLEPVEVHPPRDDGYLPPLRFSPLAGVAKVFHSQPHAFGKTGGRASDPDGNQKGVYSRLPCIESMSLSKTRHVGPPTSPCIVQGFTTFPIQERSRSCKGLAIEGPLWRTLLPENERRIEVQPTRAGIHRTSFGSSRSGSLGSKKPLKSCLRQQPVSPSSVFSPSVSETSHATRRSTAGDQACIQTPITDNDIGMLGLDRFHWNDDIKELKVQSSHMKKDSMALVPIWE